MTIRVAAVLVPLALVFSTSAAPAAITELDAATAKANGITVTVKTTDDGLLDFTIDIDLATERSKLQYKQGEISRYGVLYIEDAKGVICQCAVEPHTSQGSKIARCGFAVRPDVVAHSKVTLLSGTLQFHDDVHYLIHLKDFSPAAPATKSPPAASQAR